MANELRFRRLRLKNWKNFQNIDVEVQDRMFLVGANAAGKSNFLDVFRFLRDLASPGGGFGEAVGRRVGGARLTAVVTLKPGETGRHYRLPTDADYAAEARAHNDLAGALDRVHAAMLLQAGGHANALRALIAAEQDRGADFLRLANALSALYPRGSREKRLPDAMLLAAPR